MRWPPPWISSCLVRLLPTLLRPQRRRRPKATTASAYLVQYARSAMACQFAVLLNAGQYDQGAEYAVAALDLIQQLEDQLTVYRDTSDVMRVNRIAATQDVPLEPELFKLLTTALRIAGETGGAFDITAGPLVKTWGFYKRAGAIPTAEDLRSALDKVGSRHVALNDARSTVHFRQAGVELNLGAIGKGYALDRAASTLAGAGVVDFLLHGGQSSVLVRGSRGGSQAAPGRSACATRSDPSVA